MFTILNTDRIGKKYQKIESNRIKNRQATSRLRQTFHEIVIFVSLFFLTILSLSFSLTAAAETEYQFSHEIRVSRPLFRGIYGTRRDYETDEVLRRRESRRGNNYDGL